MYLETKELHPAIIQVTLKRPEKRNALSLQLMHELCSFFDRFKEEETPYRIVIITGDGPSFCSGLDLQEAADHSLEAKIPQQIAHLFTSVYTCPLVTIAAIQGDALAGGAGLTAACDYALLAKEARMGFPEVRRGLVAAQVATLLYRQMPMRHVKELLLTGELIDSWEALRMGLVNRVVEKEELLSEATALAHLILKGAPLAIKETKHLLNDLYPASFSEDLELALSVHRTIKHSDEVEEGLTAFLEKRPPHWAEKE